MSRYERNHVLIIKSRKGRYISPFSEVPSEQEVLFLPKSYFKVIKRNGNETTVEEVGL
ncbi:MAG: ADP-ribosyltransferase domain-containing protein [Pseudobdellovibrionaceae bacterium]